MNVDMAFIRRIFATKSHPKTKPSPAMTTTAKEDTQVDPLSEQTAALTLDEGKYDPNTVPREVATFALS